MKPTTISLASLALLAACGGGGSNPPDAPPGDPDAATADASPDAPAGTMIAISVDAIPGAPYHVVYQDGTGPWARATDMGGDAWSFPVATGRYGVGITCVDADWQEGVFNFATVADDAPALYASCGFSFPPTVTHTVSGTVSGLTGGGYRARIGSASVVDMAGGTTATYSELAAEGIDTLIFGRYPSGDNDHINRLAIARDVDISTDLVHDVNFVTDGVATQSRPVTLNGLTAAESPFAFVQLRTASFNTMTLTIDTAAPATADVPAAAQWETGDNLSVFMSADNFPAYRQVAAAYGTFADVPAQLTPTLPDPLPDASVTAVASGSRYQFRAAAGTSAQATNYAFYLFSVFGVSNVGCTDGTCLPYWYLQATPAYVATALALITPDPAELEALGAWDDRLDMPAGNDVYYDLSAFHADADFTYYAGAGDQLVVGQ